MPTNAYASVVVNDGELCSLCSKWARRICLFTNQTCTNDSAQDFSVPLAALPDSLFTQMMAVAMDNCGVSSETDSRFAIQ